MALVKVQLSPGIDKQDTEYGAEGRWFDGDNVRFRYGLPEKIGGWAKVTSDALLGAARGMRAWFSLDGDPYTITGTNKKLTSTPITRGRTLHPFVMPQEASRI